MNGRHGGHQWDQVGSSDKGKRALTSEAQLQAGGMDVRAERLSNLRVS